MNALEKGAVVFGGIILFAALAGTCNPDRSGSVAAINDRDFKRDGGAAYVTAADLGSEWPLTVQGAHIACQNSAVTATINGTEYAVNGTARSRGYPDIDPYWAAGEYAPKKSIGSLIQYGLSLCGR
jgi:hypothetical protein